MAILSASPSFAATKGDSVTVTLSRSELAAIITGDSYYANELVMRRVVVVFKNQNQTKVLDFPEGISEGVVTFSAKVKEGSFELMGIQIQDFDNGSYVLTLSELNAIAGADFTISDDAILSSGIFDALFIENADGFDNLILSIAVQSDGKIIIGGGFTNYKGQIGKSGLIRLNSDGTEDTAFSDNAVTGNFGFIYSIAVQSDGKIIIGGGFTNYKGQTGKNNLIRLNADGTEDTAFSNNAVVRDVGGTPTANFSSVVYSIAVQSDGKILVGGDFADYKGQTGKNNLIRLNADGTEDTAFSDNAVVRDVGGTPTANFSSIVYSIAVQSDGKVLVNGGFTDYKGQTGKSYLIRLNADGTEDTAFSDNAVVRDVGGTPTANFDFFVAKITIQSDGKILVSGFFTNYKGQTGKSYLIRLNSNGTEDTAFSDNAVVRDVGGTPTANFDNNITFGVEVQSDGKIIIGGDFANYKGQTGKSRLIRLNADGTEDTAFSDNAVVRDVGGTPTANFNSGSIYRVALHPEGKILVGGGFSYITQTESASNFVAFS